jgi:hypothetical protein
MAFLVVGAVAWFAANSTFLTPKGGTGAAPTASVPRKLKIGDVGVLQGAGADTPAYLFVDRPAYDEFARAVGAQDPAGTNQALTHSTAVISGAHAREIEADGDGGAIFVRVKDGPSAGRAGWTSVTTLRPIP